MPSTGRDKTKHRAPPENLRDIDPFERAALDDATPQMPPAEEADPFALADGLFDTPRPSAVDDELPRAPEVASRAEERLTEASTPMRSRRSQAEPEIDAAPQPEIDAAPEPKIDAAPEPEHLPARPASESAEPPRESAGAAEPPLEEASPVPYLGRSRRPPDDALGLLAGESVLPVPRRRRRRFGRRGLALTVGALLVAGVVAVVVLPVFLLERAREATAACFADFESSGEGDPADCVPSLWLARALPWFAGDAVQLEVDAAYRAAILGYAQATAVEPDAARRDDHARRVHELGFGVIRPTTEVGPLAALPGAFEAQVALALASDDKRIRAQGFASARALGDGAAMKTLAGHSDPADEARSSLRRGAALCLLGERSEGQRALVAADEAARAEGRERGLGEARLALLACGYQGELVDPRDVGPELAPALARFEAAVGHLQGADRARELLAGPLDPELRLRLATLAFEADEVDVLAALSALAPQSGTPAAVDTSRFHSPWRLFDPSAPRHLVLADPDAASAVASALEGAPLSDDPLSCVGAECPAETVLSRPRASARQLGRMLWLDAAATFTRRGAVGAAVKALARAEALTEPLRRHETAALHLALGDGQAALSRLEDASSHPPLERLRIEIVRALALARLGRFDEALAAAEAAYVASVRAEPDVPGGKELEALGAARAAAAWLWAAFGAHLGRGREIATTLEQAGLESLLPVVEWLELAISAEHERRPLRLGASLAETSPSVLPAVMFLVGQALPPGGAVEIWLDRVFDEVHRREPLRAMLARAEAARWRRDAAAEKRWLGRAAGVRSLPGDERGHLLALLAHLH